MKILPLLAAAALVLATSHVARAQEPAILIGRLSTTDGRGPIGGAVVRLVASRSEQTLVLVTDDNGRFTRVGVRPGLYRATIVRAGFADVEVVDIDVRTSDHVRLNVEMTPYDEAPFRRQTIRYRRPLVNVENAAISTRIL
jgi:hypothetical protein